MNPVFKQVTGFEGLYEISDSGVLVNKKGRTKATTVKRGYETVTIWKNGKQSNKFIHQLVALAFIPNPMKYTQVNHIDGDKLNNSIDNLEWCDGFGNMKHAKETGLLNPRKGVEHPATYLTSDQILEIYALSHESDLTQTQIADKFGISARQTVSDIKLGKRWKHLTNSEK